MKKFNKIISMLLAAIMILSSLAALFTVGVFAEDQTETGTETGTDAEGETGTETGSESAEKEAFDHITTYFATPEEKLASMDVAYKSGDIKLYVDSTSGEVAYVNEKTGEKLFTNPYDVAASTGNESTKYEILSQIIVTFTDSNGQERVFTSYEQAAERGQITIENIKNGIRVEYAIGREQSKILVPRLISMERFEEMILQPLLEVFGDELYNPRSQNTDVFDVQKALSYFMIYSVDELDLSDTERTNMENTFGGLFDNLRESDAQYARALKKFPIIETMPVYVFDPEASEKELTRAEEIIQKYCPEYTYEELEYDHILTEYKSDDANPPVFRMALEYKVDKDGLSVRLPANGIRFNESLYTLEHIEILPYMGAGNSAYEGYNFFPDGSGTLFDFQNLNTNQTRAVSGKVYGTDFAYHEITGTYQKTIRYPVFGIVENMVSYTYEKYNSDGEMTDKSTIAGNIVEAIKAYKKGESASFCKGQAEGLADFVLNQTGDNAEKTLLEIITSSSSVETKNENKHGFVCIIEEGDALASLSTYHAGALSDYNAVKMQFTPRPKDSYNISDSISVGENSEWTVVSDRKYVGNYSMKYITLSSADKATEDDTKAYDASWFGMAVAYRDYLTNNNIISKLTEEELTSDIPLYIETFGAIETTEKILSIPVTVMAPLTTFDNIEQMYDELSAQGMKNINFKLTGYANGGMHYTMPGNLKFEKAVGGKQGFIELLEKAADVNKQEDSNFGVFPDFDFAYMSNSALFDGHSAYKHNAQTIDGRYASKRVYSATQQKYENYYDMVISPAYFADFYEKLTENYKKYENVIGISVSSLGSALNSDFDEDEPYNREDAKKFTADAFKYFSENYDQVMTDAGNAYTWKYVDHILGVYLDSSRYNFASEAVPFIGVVLHGSIRFAGEPLNMEGDLQYAMLKAIENGASPYFILSYQNTQVLKEDKQLSKYYSIRYDIWKDDIYDTYSVLNDVLKDVQDKYIVGHSFLPGAERIPDSDELANDILSEYEYLLESQRNASVLLEKELERAASIARENGRLAEEYAAEAVVKVMEYYNKQMDYINRTALHDSTYYNNLSEAYAEFAKVSSLKNSGVAEERRQYEYMEMLYYIVQHHNISLQEAKQKYASAYNKYLEKSELASFSEYGKFVDDVHKKYSSSKSITKAQVNYLIICAAAKKKVSEELAKYKAGSLGLDALLESIDKYGVAYADLSDFENTVKKYIVNGNLKDDKFKSEIDKWFDSLESKTSDELKDELAKFRSGSVTESDICTFIGKYSASKLVKDDITAKADALIAAKNTYSDIKSKYDAEIKKSDDTRNPGQYIEDLDAAREAYASAETDIVYSVIPTLNQTEKDQLRADYTACADKYYEYLAAVDALEAVKALGEENSFDEYFNVYLEQYKNEKYKSYSNVVKDPATTYADEDMELFCKYYDASAAEDVISSAISEKERNFSRKNFENYIGALIQMNWMKANSDKVTDADFAKQEATVKQTRRAVLTAITSSGLMLSDEIEAIIGSEKMAEIIESTGALKLEAIASTTLREIQKIYDTAHEHVVLAEAAIEVLAASENYVIRYNGEKDLLNIDLDDPDMPFIVREAVERAQATYYYIEEDRYDEVVDGYKTPYTHEGHAVYQSVKNSNIYFYGTYEAGYQYLKMVTDGSGNVSFAVYDLGLSKKGQDKNGNIIYENVDKAFGKDVYFTISGGKMTYYVQLASGVYAERTPTVYDGVQVYERDGVKIYKDGDVYYSVNEDGTYTRYTYTRCIKSCYDEIVAAGADVIEAVASIQNNAQAGDATILDDILGRMEINERISRRNNSDNENDDNADGETSKYATDNIVCVVYGNDDGSAYKTIILNYNNYSIKIEYDGVLYTIPAHYFVIHNEEGGEA